MLTNTDLTIYHRVHEESSDTWQRQYVKKAWHHENSESTVGENGILMADKHTARITDLTIIVAKDDYVVVGEGPEIIETVRDLEGFDYFRVLGANYNKYGLNPHIKVVG